MKDKIVECVPNISEGQDKEKIKILSDEIKSVKGVKLLLVESGYSTNRTVFTFIGEINKVCEAVYKLAKKVYEIIDMRDHKGIHPRFGAIDVCPLIPFSNISIEETVEYSIKLAKRIGDEIGLPIYCYEYSAFKPDRKKLENCRRGEYEGLKDKMICEDWIPDFGSKQWNETAEKMGAMAIGVRDFLIAVNFDLDTDSLSKANYIASRIRESGYIEKENGIKILDKKGNFLNKPGIFEGVKAIGWYIEEFKNSQVSINITNISKAPLHKVFEEVSRIALSKNIKVKSTEIIGLAPISVYIDAANYFLEKYNLPKQGNNNKMLEIATTYLKLKDNATKKCIESFM